MGGPGSGGRRSNPGGRPRKKQVKRSLRLTDDVDAALVAWGEARGLDWTAAAVAAMQRGMRCTEE
jgi:hypothetical protein